MGVASTTFNRVRHGPQHPPTGALNEAKRVGFVDSRVVPVTVAETVCVLKVAARVIPVVVASQVVAQLVGVGVVVDARGLDYRVTVLLEGIENVPNDVKRGNVRGRRQMRSRSASSPCYDDFPSRFAASKVCTRCLVYAFFQSWRVPPLGSLVFAESPRRRFQRHCCQLHGAP